MCSLYHASTISKGLTRADYQVGANSTVCVATNNHHMEACMGIVMEHQNTVA